MLLKKCKCVSVVYRETEKDMSVELCEENVLCPFSIFSNSWKKDNGMFPKSLNILILIRMLFICVIQGNMLADGLQA